jgi:hypothetical protein
LYTSITRSNSVGVSQESQLQPEAVAARAAAAALADEERLAAAAPVVHDDNEWRIEAVPESNLPTGSTAGTSATQSKEEPQQLPEGLSFSHVRTIASHLSISKKMPYTYKWNSVPETVCALYGL